MSNLVKLNKNKSKLILIENKNCLNNNNVKIIDYTQTTTMIVKNSVPFL